MSLTVYFHYYICHMFKHRTIGFLGDLDLETKGIGKYTFNEAKLPINYLDRIKSCLEQEYKKKGYKLKIFVYSIFPAKSLINGDIFDISFEHEEQDINIKLKSL